MEAFRGYSLRYLSPCSSRPLCRILISKHIWLYEHCERLQSFSILRLPSENELRALGTRETNRSSVVVATALDAASSVIALYELDHTLDWSAVLFAQLRGKRSRCAHRRSRSRLSGNPRATVMKFNLLQPRSTVRMLRICACRVLLPSQTTAVQRS